MNVEVLAAIDDSPMAALVLRAAQDLAASLGGAVRALHVSNGDDRAAQEVAGWAHQPLEIHQGDVEQAIVGTAREVDAAVVVIGSRALAGGKRPGGHVAMAVITVLDRPVLVVPPDARLPESGRFERILWPLEGTTESSRAMANTIPMFIVPQLDPLAVHVLVPSAPIRFWDQRGHAGESWRAEFRHRWCPGPAVDLHVRTGEIATEVLDLATREHADLIALTWARDLSPGRAVVVREVMNHASIPVLLLPIHSDGDRKNLQDPAGPAI